MMRSIIGWRTVLWATACLIPATLDPLTASGGQPPPDERRVYRTDGEHAVDSPVVFEKKSPRYPKGMRKQRLEARIILSLIVTAEGRTRDIESLQCQVRREGAAWSPDLSDACPSFVEASTRAVREWRFHPSRVEGEAVDVYWATVIDFELS
jgi:hypothetical protein